jgi:hypothetical protein
MFVARDEREHQRLITPFRPVVVPFDFEPSGTNMCNRAWRRQCDTQDIAHGDRKDFLSDGNFGAASTVHFAANAVAPVTRMT